MRISKLSTVAALAVALAACGGGGAATGGATPTNAPAGATAGPGATPTEAAAAATPGDPKAVAAEMCTLFTVADLKAATTLDYGAGVADDYGSCTWDYPGPTSSDHSKIFAAIQDATLDYIKSTFGGGTALTVGGHAAYWNVLQDIGSIWVDVNGRLFVLSISPGTADSQASMVTLAGIAAPKL